MLQHRIPIDPFYGVEMYGTMIYIFVWLRPELDPGVPWTLMHPDCLHVTLWQSWLPGSTPQEFWEALWALVEMRHIAQRLVGYLMPEQIVLHRHLTWPRSWNYGLSADAEVQEIREACMFFASRIMPAHLRPLVRSWFCEPHVSQDWD